MHVLSVIQVQDRLRWVLIRHDKTIVIERMEESLSIPADVLSIKNLRIVTGLDGASVLRRDLKLPLTSARTLKAALPFQLEPLLPFPLEQSIVYPQFHPKGAITTATTATCGTPAAIATIGMSGAVTAMRTVPGIGDTTTYAGPRRMTGSF